MPNKIVLDAFLHKFICEIAYLSFQTFYPNFMYRKSMNITITNIKDLYSKYFVIFLSWIPVLIFYRFFHMKIMYLKWWKYLPGGSLSERPKSSPQIKKINNLSKCLHVHAKSYIWIFLFNNNFFFYQSFSFCMHC